MRQRRGGTGEPTASEWESQSHFTVEEKEEMAAVAALLVDYTVSLKNTRKFEPQLKVMRVLGIDEYDRCGGLDKLIIDMKKALAEFKLKWKTLDMQRIEEIMRLCIVRELQ